MANNNRHNFIFSNDDEERYDRFVKYRVGELQQNYKNVEEMNKLAEDFANMLDGIVKPSKQSEKNKNAFSQYAYQNRNAKRPQHHTTKPLSGFTPTNSKRQKEEKDRSEKLVYGTMELKGKRFEYMKLTGHWAKLLGKPASNAKIMIYGKPGNGKSTFALKFAGYLAKDRKKKVLYVAAEEKISATLNEKLDRLDVRDVNLFVSPALPYDISEYDAIFMDSVNFMEIDPKTLMEMRNDKLYFYVMQSTKSGQFRGSNEYSHNVDTVLKADKMTITVDKNRFGGNFEPFKVLDDD